jgi:hypothetical protein
MTLDMTVTSVGHSFKPHVVPDCRRPGLYAYRTWTKSFGRVVQILVRVC